MRLPAVRLLQDCGGFLTAQAFLHDTEEASLFPSAGENFLLDGRQWAAYELPNGAVSL